MVDDSELDYIKTFLGKVHTTMTFKHYSEERDMKRIASATRGQIRLPEIMNANELYTVKKYLIKLETATEALMSTAINNIMIGCGKINNGTTITAYTKETSLSKVFFVSANKAFEDSTGKKWNQDIYLEFVWRVS